MELKQFLELFNPYPGNHYLQITTSVDETTDALYDMMQKVDGEFSLVIYDTQKIESLPKYPNANIQSIQNFKNPFRALPRTHDIVIFKDRKPIALTSARYAANSIFGDGYGGSPDNNGFIIKYQKQVKSLLADNKLNHLERTFNQIFNNHSLSFFDMCSPIA